MTNPCGRERMLSSYANLLHCPEDECNEYSSVDDIDWNKKVAINQQQQTIAQLLPLSISFFFQFSIFIYIYIYISKESDLSRDCACCAERKRFTILSEKMAMRRGSGSLRGLPGEGAADLERDFEMLMVRPSLFIFKCKHILATLQRLFLITMNWRHWVCMFALRYGLKARCFSRTCCVAHVISSSSAFQVLKIFYFTVQNINNCCCHLQEESNMPEEAKDMMRQRDKAQKWEMVLSWRRQQKKQSEVRTSSTILCFVSFYV